MSTTETSQLSAPPTGQAAKPEVKTNGSTHAVSANSSQTIRQTTIKNPVSISGVGLHTGVTATITFKPAAENHGYQFQRIDHPTKQIIEADVDNVTDVNRGTTIGKNG